MCAHNHENRAIALLPGPDAQFVEVEDGDLSAPTSFTELFRRRVEEILGR